MSLPLFPIERCIPERSVLGLLKPYSMVFSGKTPLGASLVGLEHFPN
jgi:hypothetical protein